MYKDLEIRKEKVRKYIRDNPNATVRDIKSKFSIKINRLYNGGMKEAFEDAKIRSPRSFKIKSIEEKRKILIDYIKSHPKAGGQTIRKDTKINLFTVFENTKDVYEAAGINYPRINSYDRTPKEKRKKIIDLIKANPFITLNEIIDKSKSFPHKLFGSMEGAYNASGVKRISGQMKRTSMIKKKIINFIEQNPLVTQREINKSCNTHVQDIFEKGIFEAYELANKEFPYQRLRLYGVGLKEVRDRAKKFEEDISIKLSGYGKVNRLVKSKRGFADIVFERKGEKSIIEIKDYLAKDISSKEIKQLARYLDDFNCKLGFLVCHKKPKKNRFLMGGYKIFILEENELKLIPKIMTGVSDNV
ncbi:MAG: hypothetical protein IH845_04190 [Nanoarchaeota archaeon]|nr:hypothetical protein [Nanoarchaeota archaeon]